MTAKVGITLSQVWNGQRSAPITWIGDVEGDDPHQQFVEAYDKAALAWERQNRSSYKQTFVVDWFCSFGSNK